MKLYIWNEPYKVSYGGACIYVVASSLEEARELAKTAPIAYYGNPAGVGATLGVSRVAMTEIGEPSRVLDVPCAECFHWEE